MVRLGTRESGDAGFGAASDPFYADAEKMLQPAAHPYRDTASAATKPDDGDDPAVVGAGILHIRPLDFARQLTTFRAVGPAPLAGLTAFGKLFLGELWQVYGHAVANIPYPFRPRS